MMSSVQFRNSNPCTIRVENQDTATLADCGSLLSEKLAEIFSCGTKGWFLVAGFVALCYVAGVIVGFYLLFRWLGGA